jgi:hypothetical protein
MVVQPARVGPATVFRREQVADPQGNGECRQPGRDSRDWRVESGSFASLSSTRATPLNIM